jgi:hypothetical protein
MTVWIYENVKSIWRPLKASLFYAFRIEVCYPTSKSRLGKYEFRRNDFRCRLLTAFIFFKPG